MIRRLLIALSILAMLADCSCHRKVLTINQILIDRLPSAENIPFDRDRIFATTLELLKTENQINLALDDEKIATLRVRVRMESRRVVVDLKYSKRENNQLKQSFGTGFSDNFEGALKNAVDDWLSLVSGQKQSSRASIKLIERHLNGDPVSVRVLIEAIRKLGEQKNRQASGLLVKELSSSHEQIAFAALAALTHIADPSTMDAISTYAERKPAEIRKQAILAARQIGGVHAAAWLFTLSTGHEDPEVRDAAKSALIDVEKRLKR